MRIAALRNIAGSISKALISPTSTTSFFPSPKLDYNRFALVCRGGGGGSFPNQLSRRFSIFSESNQFNSLTDTRFPKRRPQIDKSRRKRSSLKPPGPYAWVKHAPGEPIQPSNPNKGSVKQRNEKKRIKLHRAFIKVEAKKRKVEMQEAKKKKLVKRVERKMAAVARDRAWAQRLAELQQLEQDKKKSMA
ncbi:uncharacterized protein LOC126676187 [Mercurialis annua]|uniref:uncharacterized protein LOC126676187 n=1 Tax=Mercurialis annua TaxID=3986 RepID=UPI00215FE414|nr:uncharacterized protein LOC126676187 [Mercurialis annua]